jgi:adenylosuccinate synthase
VARACAESERADMPNIAVVGGQWGDEGKGKIVDLLAERFDIVARWQGGPNAGHTVRTGGRSFFLHQVPAGLLREQIMGVLGNGMVLDPAGLLKEIAELEGAGHRIRGRLLVSNRAHVILPIHRVLDTMAEEGGEGDALGTTRRGIGPAYASKAARHGLRVVDLQDEEAIARRVAHFLSGGAAGRLRDAGHLVPEPAALAAEYGALGREMRDLVAETSLWLNDRIAAGAKVLFEGAQGTMLDVDLGTYPYVTSSNAVASGLGAGLGVGPTRVTGVVGVFKAYATRVGLGPLPTELHDAAGHEIRERGREYGTTTGRPRRTGWFDGVAARYSVAINGFDSAALTLFDVLDTFAEIPICVGYRYKGMEIREFPAEPWVLEEAEPLYEILPGWETDTSRTKRFEDLPANARAYVERLQELLGCEIGVVSVGADREQTIPGPGSYLREFLEPADARKANGPVASQPQ